MTIVILHFLAFVIGSVFGSFTVTAAVRAMRDEQALFGRSRCDHCQIRLGYMSSLPLMSYIATAGRCGRCKGRIDWAHPIGELVGGLMALSTAFVLAPLRALLAFLLGLALLAASTFDVRELRLPNRLNLAIAGLAASLAADKSFNTLMIGLGAAALVLIALQSLRFMRGRHGQDAGLGLGDVKLLAALAIWLGLDTPIALTLASLLGLAAMIFWRPGTGRLPFGPAIAIASWAVGLCQEFGWPTI